MPERSPGPWSPEMCRGPCAGSDDNETDNKYQYVGEGRGGYRIEQEVVWVGDGKGSFDMQDRPIWQEHIREFIEEYCKRDIAIQLLYGGIMVMTILCLITGIALLFPGVSGALNSSLPLHGLRPQTTPSPYHCTADAPMSAEQTAWCCFHKRIGCQSSGGSQFSLHSCDTMCSVKGEYHPCRDRIKFAAANEFSGQANACLAAWTQVKRECDVCSSCGLAESGCPSPSASTDTPVPAAPSPMPMNQHPSRTAARSSPAYCDISDCQNWGAQKKKWCTNIVGNVCEGLAG